MKSDKAVVKSQMSTTNTSIQDELDNESYSIDMINVDIKHRHDVNLQTDTSNCKHDSNNVQRETDNFSIQETTLNSGEIQVFSNFRGQLNAAFLQEHSHATPTVLSSEFTTKQKVEALLLIY